MKLSAMSKPDNDLYCKREADTEASVGQRRFESFLDELDNYQYVAKFQQICGLKEVS